VHVHFDHKKDLYCGIKDGAESKTNGEVSWHAKTIRFFGKTWKLRECRLQLKHGQTPLLIAPNAIAGGFLC